MFRTSWGLQRAKSWRLQNRPRISNPKDLMGWAGKLMPCIAQVQQQSCPPLWRTNNGRERRKLAGKRNASKVLKAIRLIHHRELSLWVWNSMHPAVLVSPRCIAGKCHSHSFLQPMFWLVATGQNPVDTDEPNSSTATILKPQTRLQMLRPKRRLCWLHSLCLHPPFDLVCLADLGIGHSDRTAFRGLWLTSRNHTLYSIFSRGLHPGTKLHMPGCY